VCYGHIKDDRQYNLEEVSTAERESLQLFLVSIKKAIDRIADAYHVYPEIRYVDFADIRAGTSRLTDDPGYLSHLVDIRDNYPGFTVGDPLGYIETYAIDATNNLTVAQESQIVSSSLRYMTNRANFFSSAQTVLPDHLVLKALQRALEFAKAAVRKTIQVDMVDRKNPQFIKPDVTSRQSMYAAFKVLIDKRDKDKTLTQPHTLLAKLDAEFETLLERTIKGEVPIKDYTQWLGFHYLIAVEAALQLALGCHRYVENVAWEKGIELMEAHDEQQYRPYLIGTGEKIEMTY
jgi:hypothetical protein